MVQNMEKAKSMSLTKSTYSNYRRLFSFALRYRGRLLIGLLTGLLSAGSFFGLLAMMPNAFDAFKLADTPAQPAAAAASSELPASSEIGVRSSELNSPEAVSTHTEGVQEDNFKLQTSNSELSKDSQRLTPNSELNKDSELRTPSSELNKDSELKNNDLPDWFKKAEDYAARFNIPLRNADNSITWQALLIGLMALPLVAFARIISSFLNRYFMRWVGAAVVRDLRNELFASLQKQSLKYYGNSDIGKLISSCVNDTASVEHVISSTIAEAARAPFEIIAAILFAVIYAVSNGLGQFILIGGLLLPLCLVPVIVLGSRVRRWTKKSLEGISVLVSRMHENFTSIRVVKATNYEAEEERRFRKINHDYFRSVVKALKAEMLMSPLMELTTTVLATGFIVACFILHIKLNEIIIIGVAVIAAYRPMKQLAQINAWLQRGGAALDRIFAILDVDTSLPEAENPVHKTTFDDKIVFDNVSFAFSEGGPTVVDKASFTIPRGSLIALVGETGSGKSTYANLLARFYDPTQGQVTMDGVPINEIATKDLRKLIGVVTQDAILFNDTIANNIAYGNPDATQEQIEAAAKMANAHEFIVAHPDGYQRICGDKGFLLSGGEKQRIALARAILRNPPILILDEATSALDTVTEKLVQDAIAKVMANRTTLAIAHRLSTVRDASMILVIDKGQIIESGTHEELFAKNGRYRTLCDMQLAG